VYQPEPSGAEPRGAVERDLEAVYRAHAQRVARWAARLAGPALDVEDVVHEVFLVVQRRLAGFRGEAEITTWLYRITANVVRHRRRKERWRRFLGGTADDIAGRMAAPGPTPLEDLEGRQAAARLYRALDALNEKQRAVLILFELEGLPGEEIARLLGMRAATVRVTLHRARAELLRRLDAIERGARERTSR